MTNQGKSCLCKVIKEIVSTNLALEDKLLLIEAYVDKAHVCKEEARESTGLRPDIVTVDEGILSDIKVNDALYEEMRKEISLSDVIDLEENTLHDILMNEEVEDEIKRGTLVRVLTIEEMVFSKGGSIDLVAETVKFPNSPYEFNYKTNGYYTNEVYMVKYIEEGVNGETLYALMELNHSKDIVGVFTKNMIEVVTM